MKDIQTKQRREYYKQRYQKDWVLIGQCVLLAVLLTLLMFLSVRQLNLWALETCHAFNDCEEVLLHLNK